MLCFFQWLYKIINMDDVLGERSRLILQRVITVFFRHGDTISLSDLHQSIGHDRVISRQDLKKLLYRFNEYFECSKDSQTFVSYKSNIDICKAHCTRNGCQNSYPLCSGLHVCKFFILTGNCKFRDQCTYGHDLTTVHNKAVLRGNFLDHLKSQEVLQLLRGSSRTMDATKPKICKFYNNKGGCRHLESGRQCPHIHLCRHYLKGTCRFNRDCRRSHDIMDKEVGIVLQKHGIDTRRRPGEILQDLREIFNDDSDSDSVNSEPVFTER